MKRPRPTPRPSVLAAILALGTFASCSAETNVRRVRFELRARGVPTNSTTGERPSLRFITPQGWTVELTRALVHAGPVYFRNSSPVGGGGELEGRVVAQVLETFTIDALDPSLHVRTAGDAVTEPALSAEIRLSEASSGPIAAARGNARALAWVEGIATRAELTIAFAGALELPRPAESQQYAWFLLRRADRIPTDFVPEESGSLELTVDPTSWLSAVAFDALPGGDVRDFSSDTARAQVRNGLTSRMNVYQFNWINP